MKNFAEIDERRRTFLKRASLFAAALPVFPLGLTGCGEHETPDRIISPDDCEWCGAKDAPSNLSWQTTIAAASEPGERIAISGTVYREDGRTPAAGILIYAYHTNAQGLYKTRPLEHLHGRLRGWMMTNREGRYEFHSSRPAPYPNRTDPAHIHMTLSGKGYAEYWIDSIWFDGDPLITAAKRAGLTGRGGFNPIVNLTKNEQGVWQGVRDIRLEEV